MQTDDTKKEQVKGVPTREEMAKISPAYRGKPENFNPNKKPRAPATPAPQRLGPRSPLPTPPGRLQTKSTPQRNHSLIAESIFGVEISVTEIQPQQTLSATFAKLPQITEAVHYQSSVDEQHLDRLIAREEMSYYSTGLLWLRLLDLKSKQGIENLTQTEKDIVSATADDEFNLPAPIFTYISQIGSYKDDMGKETFLEVPKLPTTVVANLGGYHADSVDDITHNLFEEIPSLGIAGDVLMSLVTSDSIPSPDFKVRLPPGTVATENLAGNFSNYYTVRPEIRQKLAGFGITRTDFAEYLPGTRFHLRYMRHLSDQLGRLKTFENYKVKFPSLPISGGETLVIKTMPNTPVEHGNWTSTTVQARSSHLSSTAQIGAAYCFGFQLYKAESAAPGPANRIRNWSCVTGSTWAPSEAWIANANARRNIPDGVGSERFRGISERQDALLDKVIRRLCQQPR